MDLEFGQYRLKRQERLVIGPTGPVELSSRSFDILTVLLDGPNELIGKPALLDAVWPGLAVEENTLQVHISALRKALGAEMIVTAQGRGYKYAGPQPMPAANVQTASHQSTMEGKPIIVVLPFENLSGDADQQYFSDGIAGDIADRLARFRTSAVIGKHSSAAFRGPAPDFSAIQEKLKADFVVTGCVRRSGERIRIALRLSHAKSQEAIWAERYDRPISELFSIQDEISELVAAAIPRQIDVEFNFRNAHRPPASLSSYENMLQGSWHLRKLTRASNRTALQCFAKAILAGFRQQGQDPDWLLGVSREPYRDNAVRERLLFGLNAALAF